MKTIKKACRVSLGYFLRALPAGAPQFIYSHLLRFAPLRHLTQRIITSILPASVHIPEGVVNLNPADPVVSGALALGVYEPFETDVFRRALKPGMTVLDIGANLGYHTVIAASRVGAAGAVFSFEPEPTNYALLVKNIQQNHFKNVRPYEIAASERAGTLQLQVSDANKGKHSIVNTQEDSSEYTTSIPVRTETIDTVLEKAGIKNVDIIKMDIEGAEPLALRGMQKTLAMKRLTLFVEFWPQAIRRAGREPAAFLAELEAYGFTLFEILEESRTVAPITNYAEFAQPFSGDMHTNLLCVKK